MSTDGPAQGRWRAQGLAGLMVFCLLAVGTEALGLVPGQAYQQASTHTAAPPAQIETPKRTAVPSIVGLNEWVALAALEVAHLRGVNAGSELSPRPGQTVLATEPAAGTALPRGSHVRYRLASGENLVPDVRGMSRSSAEQVLKAAGFRTGTIRSLPASGTLGPVGTGQIRVGQISAQAPQAQTRAKVGASVALTITAAPAVPTVRVPDVVTLPQHEAEKELALQRLNAQLRGTVVDAGPAGRVMRLRPSAGTDVAIDSTVDYWLSTHPTPSAAPTSPVRVPDVVGRGEADAAAILRKDRLQPLLAGREPATADVGTVLRTQPPAATSVQAGDRVRYWLASPALATVPDIVGLEEDRARQQLLEAGLRPLRAGASMSAKARGIVLRSEPAGASRAAPQAEVAYWVASGDNIVPDVRELTATEAGASLQSAGFVAAVAIDNGDARVAAQRPAAGSKATLGTPIALTLSASASWLPWTLTALATALGSLVMLRLLLTLKASVPRIRIVGNGEDNVRHHAPHHRAVDIRLRARRGRASVHAPDAVEIEHQEQRHARD